MHHDLMYDLTGRAIAVSNLIYLNFAKTFVLLQLEKLKFFFIFESEWEDCN